MFRNGTFVSKEPIAKQQTATTLCFETTTNNSCPSVPPPLHQQQITATGLQAAAQIVACNVLRQATLNGKRWTGIDDQTNHKHFLFFIRSFSRCIDRAID